MFENLITIAKVVAWIVDLFFTGSTIVCIVSMYSDGKTAGATISLMCGIVLGCVLAAQNAHILIILFLTPLATWWVASFFDSSLRADDDPPARSSTEDDESWDEFALKHITNYMVAREIDKAIEQQIEDARSGNDRNGNLHI